MANTDMTIDYNGGTPIFSPRPGSTDLHVNDTVTLALSGFPAGSTITKVEFFGNKVVSGTDEKDTTVNRGAWDRATGTTPVLNGKFTVSANSTIEVKITDVEALARGTEDKYWFAVEGNPTWEVDPELINKSNT